MDDGGLVGDEIMIGIVNERLTHHDAKGARVHPRRLPANREAGTGPRRDHGRAADRSGSRSRCAPRARARPAQCPAGLPRLRYQLRGQWVREVTVDLRGLRWRRHASRRRHARGHRTPPRPLRGTDGSAHRVLPEPRPARGRRRSRHARRRCSGCSRRPSTPFAENDEAHCTIRRPRTSCGQMRAAGRVVAEMHRPSVPLPLLESPRCTSIVSLAMCSPSGTRHPTSSATTGIRQ